MLSSRKLYILSISLAIIAAFTPFFPNEMKVVLFLFAIIMDLAVNKNTLINSRPLHLLIIFYFISFFYVFVLGRGHFVALRNISLSYPMMLMCFWIAPGLLNLKKKEAKFIWIVFFLCLAENIVVTTIIGQTNPLILRYYFTKTENDLDIMEGQAYSRLGLLPYSSAHILASLCPFLVVKVFEVNKVWKKIALLFIAVLSIYLLYLVTVTTSLLLGLIFMAAVVVYHFTKGNTKSFIVWFSILAVVLLATGGLTGLLSSGSKGGNYEIAEKLNDLSETIVTGEGQGQVAARENIYDITWSAIAKNPFFGGAEGPDDTGQHSLFLDYWAYYGIFCLFLFIGWWKEVKRLKKILDEKRWMSYLLCLIPIILLCFLKGPVFLPNYVLATIVILRVGFLSDKSEVSQIKIVTKNEGAQSYN